MLKRLHAKKHVIASFPVYCVFFTEIDNKKLKLVDILEQSLSQTRLRAIFEFIDWFTII